MVSILLIMAVLAADLAAQQPALNSSMQQQVSTFPSTSLVQVNLKEGDSVRGRIVRRTDSDFSLERENGKQTQTIAYDQVLSVSQVKGGHSHKKRWIIIGVVAGAAVVAIVFAYQLTHLKI
jgi:hypothetical protein